MKNLILAMSLLLTAGSASAQGFTTDIKIADVSLQGISSQTPYAQGILSTDSPQKILSVRDNFSSASARFSAENFATDGRVSAEIYSVTVKHDRNIHIRVNDEIAEGFTWYQVLANVVQKQTSETPPPAYICQYQYGSESGEEIVISGIRSQRLSADQKFEFVSGFSASSSALTLIVRWIEGGRIKLREFYLDHGQAQIQVKSDKGIFNIQCDRGQQ